MTVKGLPKTIYHLNTHKNSDLHPDRHWQVFNSRCSYCALNYDVIGRAETFNEDAK